MSLVPANVRSVDAGSARVMFGSNELVVRVPAGLALRAGQDVRLCIRPETLQFAEHGGTGARIAGDVARRSFLGDRMRYWVVVDGREWIVDQEDPGASPPLDGRVSLALRPDLVHVIAA